MNRFRTKKRAKDDLSAGRSSEESEQSSLSFFRKGKKAQQEETKKEFDLSNALPSNDDFRTSLLMVNLSARFSMLKEQDDPNTKIGKASDDSVLYPKRQSRLADFGFGGGAGGLADIAEVESVRGPNFLRTTSVASEDPDQGNGANVMTRARPAEGNNLFGGRQKIYKVPASSGGGMSGRALYEDDVALSAFQRWRQAEKERSLQGLEGTVSDGVEGEAENRRAESPPLTGYNRKRETSSTTSSVSILARNSTAATSVASQSAGAAKDGQSTSSTSASALASPILERNVTRTRRLYEQGFNQEGHDHQGSVLSRIESLNRQRPFGIRTPETDGVSDRFASSNRTVLAKASAPDLRSASPPAVGRSVGTPDLGIRLQTDTKANLGGLPPLSPPVSETGEQPILPILPKDLGKATAMGIFEKPSHPYDESQYVQRQLQLQQGRETPTWRNRGEPNDKSALLFRNQEPKPVASGTRPAAPDARLPPTPVADTETPQPATVSQAGLPVPGTIERPSDEEHPAFRQPAMPTPPSIAPKVGMDSSSSLKPKVSVENSQQPSPEDSPTLGPAAGLSGLVRQHLRTESVDSSLGGAGPDVSHPEPRFRLDLNSPPAVGGLGSKPDQLSSFQDWTQSGYPRGPESVVGGREGFSQAKADSPDSRIADRMSAAAEDEADEFASQLADARRRVREKLTSYVESDSSRAASPQLLPSDSPSQPGQSSNPLGILKPKSSRGSLIDRSRNIVGGQSKGLKVLGLGASTMSTSSQPGKPSFEEYPTLQTMKEDSREHAPRETYDRLGGETSAEPSAAGDGDEDSNAHPGLRAFRQARRELQRRKELETLARHQIPQTAQSADQPLDQANGMHPARADRGPRQRTPSRERRPPPVTYRQRPPSDEHSYSSPSVTRPSGERSRSGSETSGGRPSSRPPRLRTGTNTGTGLGPHDQLGPLGSGRPMMRSPGLPGTDIKGSPVMPPYPYPGRGAPSPAPSPHLERSRSATNLALHTGRPGLDPHLGQPSPISPMGLPSPAPYATAPAGSPLGTPTSLTPRPRLLSASQSPAFGPATGGTPVPMKRPVDKREISEPTLVMSTSRVPTTTLPQHPSVHPPHSQYLPPPHQPPPMVPGMADSARPQGGPRSRSNSRAAASAPPVPPINPRRRREDSRTRPPQEEGELATPWLPFGSHANNSAASLEHASHRSAFPTSDDETGNKSDQRRRLRKPHPDMQGPGPRPFPGRSRDNSPSFVAKGPPASRTMATSNMGANPGMGVPGGMI